MSHIIQASADFNNDGKIPFPCKLENAVGGHAVVAVGYDDNLKIKNNTCGIQTEGAFLIRNSWGADSGRSRLWMAPI